MTVFGGQEWVFQQDSAPAHKAKTTQKWLQRSVLAFVTAEDWPSGSPDLNPLDYKLWAVLEDMVCRKCHNMPEEPEEFPCEGSGRDPTGDGACGNSRVAGVSQGLRQGTGCPF